MTSYALPFLTIPSELVVAEPWSMRDDAGSLSSLPKVLEHWDYARDISLVRTLSLDFGKASKSLEIALGELDLAIAVRAGTGAGILPRLVLTTKVHQMSPNVQQEISLQLEGRALSKRLHLECMIVLARPFPGGRLSPRLSGSRLWSDTHDVELEGEAPRFPIEIISFSRQFPRRPEENALWYLQWSPFSLQLEFSAGVQLYLNKDNEAFIQRMVDGDQLTVRTVLADIMIQMISGVILQEDIDNLLDGYETHTVGWQISHWIRKAFHGQSIAAVRDMLTHRPTLFHASIQSVADMDGVAA